MLRIASASLGEPRHSSIHLRLRPSSGSEVELSPGSKNSNMPRLEPPVSCRYKSSFSRCAVVGNRLAYGSPGAFLPDHRSSPSINPPFPHKHLPIPPLFHRLRLCTPPQSLHRSTPFPISIPHMLSVTSIALGYCITGKDRGDMRLVNPVPANCPSLNFAAAEAIAQRRRMG